MISYQLKYNMSICRKQRKSLARTKVELLKVFTVWMVSIMFHISTVHDALH